MTIYLPPSQAFAIDLDQLSCARPRSKERTCSYVVHVRLDDGSSRTFTYGNPTSYKVGDKVKIVDKKLVRR